MADTKISALTAATTINDADLVTIVQGGDNKKATFTTLQDDFREASTTVKGKVEVATVTETNTGTDATKAVSPAGLEGWTGSENITTLGTITAGNADSAVSDSSTTTKGKVELATITETNTGTDATRSITPDGLAGSNFGERGLSFLVVLPGTDVATGTSQSAISIPSFMDGMNLVSVYARVTTAGTTGVTTIDINNNGTSMLSTKITIDSSETGSDTAATPAVIDTSNDDVSTNDLITIDIDGISTTAPKGLIVMAEYRLP